MPDLRINDLYSKASAGSATDWRELFGEITPMVVGWLRKMGIAATDVEDAVSEAWVDVLSGRTAFDPQRGFREYFCGIARKKLLMIARRSLRRELESLEGAALEARPADPAAQLAAADLLTRVRRCWQMLSPTERQRLTNRFPNAADLFTAAIGQPSLEAIDQLRKTSALRDSPAFIADHFGPARAIWPLGPQTAALPRR